MGLDSREPRNGGLNQPEPQPEVIFPRSADRERARLFVSAADRPTSHIPQIPRPDARCPEKRRANRKRQTVVSSTGCPSTLHRQPPAVHSIGISISIWIWLCLWPWLCPSPPERPAVYGQRLVCVLYANFFGCLHLFFGLDLFFFLISGRLSMSVLVIVSHPPDLRPQSPKQ